MPPIKSQDREQTRSFVQRLPNLLTALRLLLVIPIGILILRQQFAAVLALAFIAGCSDAVDGWIARRFNAASRLGGIMDPLADKALMVTTFVCLSVVGVLPWWLTGLVLTRDLIIIGGVTAYYRMTGNLDMSPSWLSKLNTFLQIGFTMALLIQQVWPLLPPNWFEYGIYAVALLAIATGIDYVRIGIQKSRQHNRCMTP
jgi:cardiolipin synthase